MMRHLPQLHVWSPSELKFKLYQMDVKTAFLNGTLKEDVHVAHPKEFIDPHFQIMCCISRRHSMA